MLFCFCFCFFGCKACGILVPDHGPSAVKAQSPNHWTAGEFPVIHYFKMEVIYSDSNTGPTVLRTYQAPSCHGVSEYSVLFASFPLCYLFIYLFIYGRGILVPQPGIKPMSPVVEVQSHYKDRKSTRLNSSH